MREIEEKREDKRTMGVVGLPLLMAHDNSSDVLHFWPESNFDVEIKVLYYPPMIELL